MNFWSVYIALTLLKARTLVSCLPTFSVTTVVATTCYKLKQASRLTFMRIVYNVHMGAHPLG